MRQKNAETTVDGFRGSHQKQNTVVNLSNNHTGVTRSEVQNLPEAKYKLLVTSMTKLVPTAFMVIIHTMDISKKSMSVRNKQTFKTSAEKK